MLSLDGVNFLAVIVAAVLYMALGAAWYSPYMFSSYYIRFTGKNPNDLEASPVDYGLTFIGTLLASLVMAMIVVAIGADTAGDGAALGFVVWLGFAATSTLTQTIFNGPNKFVWGLYTSYQLVAYLLVGTLLAVWR